MQTSTRPTTDLCLGGADRAQMQRVRAEYVDMPGLNLTIPQAARLFGVTVRDAEQLLSEMVRQHFLEHDPGGLYKRRGCRHCW